METISGVQKTKPNSDILEKILQRLEWLEARQKSMEGRKEGSQATPEYVGTVAKLSRKTKQGNGKPLAQ